MPKLTIKFLEGIAETVEVLNYEGKHYFSPHISFLIALILTVISSFNKNWISQIPIIIYSLILMLILKLDFKLLAKPVLFVAFLTIIPAIPLPFIKPGQTIFSFDNYLTISLEGIITALNLIIRAITASLIFTILTLSLGWNGISEALNKLRIPSSIITSINLFIKYVPIFLRETCKTLAAREARLMSKHQYKMAWLVIASSAGELMLKAFHRAWKTQLAIEARMLSDDKMGFRRGQFSGNLLFKDLALIFSSIFIIIISLHLGGLI